MILWVKTTKDSYVVSISVGCDGLEAEDVDEGYVGYLNYNIDCFVGHAESNCGFEAHDGGMYLFKAEDTTDGFLPDINKQLPEILKYVFDSPIESYIVLDESEE